MPRVARQIADSGFYHVTCRGNGRQLLFEDDEDRRHYVALLENKARSHEVAVLAWCLMDNHVHLLLDDPKNEVSHMMHGLTTAYAQYFNSKTGHVGAVFQGRFTGVPITDDRQLLQAVRYIHENPAKANVAEVDRYRWSSYQEYLTGGGIVSRELILDMVGGPKGFRELFQDERYAYYYVRASRRVADDEALSAARCALEGRQPSDVKALCREDRDEALRRLRETGLTVKQIERLTGIGKSSITRATAVRNDMTRSQLIVGSPFQPVWESDVRNESKQPRPYLTGGRCAK